MSLFEKYRAAWPALVDCLINARKYGRMAHAFLLHADTETVRREFAVVLAQMAACPDGVGGVPCTACRVCRQLENGTYSELYTLTPVGRMYQIKVGERGKPEPNTLRFFEEQFHLTSTGGGNCKVGVIHDADRMNDESQNALLKTLEEPPPQTLLILTTGNPAALLPTTRSRCQQISLLTNRCRFDFSGASELFAALGMLFRADRGDLAAAEAGATALIRIAGGLSSDATDRTAGEWEGRIAAAAQSGDSGLAKRVELQAADAGYGAYMKERAQFLAAIQTFCSELYMLSAGVPRSDLANPEVFEGVELPAVVDPARGAMALREAEELLFTLRFNVPEELALRTFAVNLAMKQK